MLLHLARSVGSRIGPAFHPAHLRRLNRWNVPWRVWCSWWKRWDFCWSKSHHREKPPTWHVVMWVLCSLKQAKMSSNGDVFFWNVFFLFSGWFPGSVVVFLLDFLLQEESLLTCFREFSKRFFEMIRKTFGILCNMSHDWDTLPKNRAYCWWTKSCNTWDGENMLKPYKILGDRHHPWWLAGFCPSTATVSM